MEFKKLWNDELIKEAAQLDKLVEAGKLKVEAFSSLVESNFLKQSVVDCWLELMSVSPKVEMPKFELDKLIDALVKMPVLYRKHIEPLQLRDKESKHWKHVESLQLFQFNVVEIHRDLSLKTARFSNEEYSMLSVNDWVDIMLHLGKCKIVEETFCEVDERLESYLNLLKYVKSLETNWNKAFGLDLVKDANESTLKVEKQTDYEIIQNLRNKKEISDEDLKLAFEIEKRFDSLQKEKREKYKKDQEVSASLTKILVEEKLPTVKDRKDVSDEDHKEAMKILDKYSKMIQDSNEPLKNSSLNERASLTEALKIADKHTSVKPKKDVVSSKLAKKFPSPELFQLTTKQKIQMFVLDVKNRLLNLFKNPKLTEESLVKAFEVVDKLKKVHFDEKMKFYTRNNVVKEPSAYSEYMAKSLAERKARIKEHGGGSFRRVGSSAFTSEQLKIGKAMTKACTDCGSPDRSDTTPKSNG